VLANQIGCRRPVLNLSFIANGNGARVHAHFQQKVNIGIVYFYCNLLFSSFAEFSQYGWNNNFSMFVLICCFEERHPE
jgi:hypothetical protein